LVDPSLEEIGEQEDPKCQTTYECNAGARKEEEISHNAREPCPDQQYISRVGIDTVLSSLPRQKQL
jgi:hypothetical protein